MSSPSPKPSHVTALACPGEDTLVAFATRQLGSPDETHCRDHLDGCSRCRQVVAQLADVLFSPTADPVAADAPAAPLPRDGGAGRPAGRLIAGRYELGSLIGRGGMGAVYEATHVELRRPVAVKMLTPEAAASAEVVARFQREARLAASLGHENIIDVLDAGRTDDGEAFLVMERLQGSSMGRLLDERPISLRRLVSMIDQVLAALEAVHGRGIVHRDIKPENVFVVPGPDQDKIKVLDFGVSKLTRDELGTTLTRSGTLIGTPLYMSPEQILGQADVDHRADLHAVGVILYRALSGRFPYRATSLNALVAEVLSTDPVPLREVADGVHPSWQRLVDRALSKLPGDRFPDATRFRAALRSLPAAALEGETRLLLARPAGPAGAPWLPPALSVRRGSWLRRVLAAGGLVGVCVVLGLVFGARDPRGGQTRRADRQDAGIAAAPPREPGPVRGPATRQIDAGTALDVDAVARVEAAAGKEAAPATDGQIRVSVTVQPEGARVSIDGEPYRSPVITRRPRVPGQRVRIEASAPGHVTVVRREPADADIDLALQLVRTRPSSRRVPALEMKPKLE